MNASPTRFTPKLLYLGIALFLALLAVSVKFLREDWAERVEGGRALAFYELVHGYIPNRPTDTPGARAWLHWELEQYLGQTQPGTGHFLTQRQDYRAIPKELEPLARLIRQPEQAHDLPQPEAVTLGEAQADQHLQFRQQSYLHHGDNHFVVTRRRAIAENTTDLSNPSNRFLARTVAHLGQLKTLLDQQPVNPDFSVARLYTLCEDSMLTTLPLSNRKQDPATVRREGVELRKMPKLPNFVSNEFFFIFDFFHRFSQC